jgi:hypothetical protein
MAKPKKIKELAIEKEKGYDITEDKQIASSSQVSETDKPSKKSAFDKEPTKKESAAFEAFLGKVEKLSVKESGKNQTIFIDGVKSTLINNEIIKQCPLHFRWRKRANVVNDGTGAVNKGYMVVSKKIMADASFKLTVSKDDTPTEDYYTTGDSVLCCTNKHNFEKRKLEMILRSIAKPKKIKDQRNEFAKQQALNNDVEAVTDNYANVNTGDSQTMPSKFEAPKDYGDMIEKAKKVAAEGF